MRTNNNKNYLTMGLKGLFLWLMVVNHACADLQVHQAVATQKNFGTIYNHYKESHHLDNHDEHGHEGHEHDLPIKERQVGTQADFEMWLVMHPWENMHVAMYRYFLESHLGASYLPPMHQLLTTARSWQSCGAEPYQIPPKSLWENMLPTLRLYAQLRQLGILPPNTEIRSVYRNPELNRCAGGAAASKHLTNAAIDIWVPTYDVDSWAMKNLQNRLCQFWLEYGESHQFGLGIYATGAIHLDTQGYRKWGAEYSEITSPCRHQVSVPN